MEDKKIRVFHTHIEISPYTLGENERIERQLSIWVDAEYRYDPFAYYVEDNILYIPRGFNTFILQKEFNSTPYVVREPDTYKSFRGVHMTLPPKNDLQKDAIDFLTANGNFKNAISYSQQALILQTGEGKTFTTVNSIIDLRMRAIIITHQDKIKAQWIDTFLTKTDVLENKLINISGSDIIEDIMKGKREGYFYFVNHQTLNSYLKTHGTKSLKTFFKKINVGIKVFDEAHLSFKNVLKMDFFSNTKKTFYLTANFGRSDSKEAILFKRCFSSVYKYGEETQNLESTRKHIIYVPVMYRSNPTYNHLRMAMNSYGFSVLGFSKYALHCDGENTQMLKFYHILDMCSNLEGKILVTVPRIEDTEYLKTCIKTEYPLIEKKICTINSKNSKEDNDYAKENADIIISTIKSCGTGVDIHGLRCIINLEPFSSNITCNQLSGRLREYAPDKDTYFFDLIDLSFPVCERQYKTKLTCLKKKCKAIKVMNL